MVCKITDTNTHKCTHARTHARTNKQTTNQPTKKPHPHPHPKPKTQNPKPKTQNPKPKPKTQNPKPKPKQNKLNDADVDMLFFFLRQILRAGSVCVSCDGVHTQRPEGLQLTVKSARPFWQLPAESKCFLRSLPLGWFSHRPAQAAFQCLSTSRINKLSTATALWRCSSPLFGDWPALCGVGAFQHHHPDKYSPRISSGRQQSETSPELSKRR